MEVMACDDAPADIKDQVYSRLAEPCTTKRLVQTG